jgi:hypothetical protein
MFRNLELILASLVLLSGPLAFAQEAPQDPRVPEAKTACAAGDAQKAAQLLAELYTATNDPIWIFNQGRCYHQNNMLSQAVARFKEFLRKNTHGPAEDSRDAQSYINEIEAELHKNDVGPNGATAGTIAKDGSGATPDDSNGRALRYAGVGCFIFGGVALASGVVFSLLVNKTKNDVESKTANSGVPSSAISGDLTNGPRYETLQWVSYGVGATAVITGAVLYYFGARQVTSSTSTAMFSPIILNHGAGATVHLSF